MSSSQAQSLDPSTSQRSRRLGDQADDGNPYINMEYLEGEPLSERDENGSPLKWIELNVRV
jgi:hypothetical protein